MIDLIASTAERRPVCTQASHSHAKATPSLWKQFIPCGPPMVIEADEEGPGYSLELKNCPLCHSTLAVEVHP